MWSLELPELPRKLQATYVRCLCQAWCPCYHRPSDQLCPVAGCVPSISTHDPGEEHHTLEMPCIRLLVQLLILQGSCAPLGSSWEAALQLLIGHVPACAADQDRSALAAAFRSLAGMPQLPSDTCSSILSWHSVRLPPWRGCPWSRVPIRTSFSAVADPQLHRVLLAWLVAIISTETHQAMGCAQAAPLTSCQALCLCCRPRLFQTWLHRP